MLKFVRRFAATAGVLACAVALAEPAAAQGTKPTVTVGGVGYAQYLYQLSNKPTGAPAPNAFEVTRAYVNIVGKFDNGISTRITSDLYRNAGSLSLRIKYAYVAWTPKNSQIGFRFGQTQMAWLDWEEGLWGYRVQGPMALDRGGYLSSADLGLAVDGAWSGQLVNMQAGVYDGTGYHGGIGDGHKAMDARVSVRLLQTDDNGSRGGLRLTGYGLYAGNDGGGKRYRAIGMLSYKSKTVLLAGEGAITADSTTGTSTSLVKGRVLSAYGTYAIPNSMAGIIARVDYVDPNTAAASVNDRYTRLIGGVSYKIAPELMVLGDLEATSYQDPARPTLTNALFQVQFSF